MKKQWNKDIQNRLKDFQAKAPEGLLDDIKSEMSRRGLSATPVSKKHPAVFFRIASVAAVVALLFGISQLFRWQEASVLPAGQESQTFPVVTETLPSVEEEKEEPVVSVVSRLSTQANLPKATQPDTIAVKKETLSEKTTEENADVKQETQSPVRQASQVKNQTGEKSRPSEWNYTPSRKRNSSFDISVYYSGLLALDMSGKEFYIESSTPPSVQNPSEGNPPLTNPDNPEENDTASVAGRALSRSFSRNKSAEDAKHHAPVRLGLSLRYYLNDRWYMQSGLIYSYLASDLSYKGSTPYETKQKLHYVGVPLQVGYRIWESRNFRGYVTVGGQVERLVSGKATTRYTTEAQQQGTLIENISDKRLLFSALAAIGAEYQLGKDFSLYAEPGIHYYFKNGNGLKTRYNEQPLNFNITLGFRFHWEK